MKHIEEQSFAKLGRLSSFVLGISGVFCILVFFYFVYYYAWRGQRSLTTPVEMILHYVLPAVLAGAFLGSFTIDPLWRIKLSLVLLSAVISIYSANLLLALYDAKVVAATRTLDGSSQRDVGEAVKIAKRYGIEFDVRGRLEVIDDLQRRGIDSVPFVGPVNVLRDQPEDGTWKSVISLNGIEVLPHGGVSKMTTVYCNESGQYVIYQSDEHGFHNPRGLWNSTPIDVLAVGDSFAQGACVPSDNNFVALIRRRFPKTLNLGTGGNGPLNELATLMDYLDALRPKVVLWFFFEGNDIWDLHRERRSPLLMRYLTGNFKQALLHRQTEIDQALLTFVNGEKDRFNFTFPVKQTDVRESLRQAGSLLHDSARLTHLRQRLSSSLGLLNGDFNQSDVRTTAAINLLPNVLRQAKAYSEAAGSKFYFVYLPQRERYSDATFADDTRHRVFTIVKELKMPLIDIHAVFQQHGDPLELFPFRRLYHYNEKGHRLVSDAVLRHIPQ